MPDALMRGVPDSFVAALTHGERPPIDVAVARRQHDAYRTVLEGAGYSVTVLAADEAHPDCPFIEDTAVTLDGTAVITRPGAESRRGEVGPVAAVLATRLTLTFIEAPGTLDGGDVMRMGDRVFVGRSRRTNQEGIEQLARHTAALGLTVRPVDLSGMLHLKSAVLPLDSHTLLVARDHVDESAFDGYRIIPKAPGEEHPASILPLAGGTVMATASAPKTIAVIEAAGHEVVAVDVSQFQAADGGLTCLSILL